MTSEEIVDLVDGWAIYDRVLTDKVCDSLGIKRIDPGVKWSSEEDAARQGLVYVKEPQGEAVWALSLGYHICQELGIDSHNRFTGRGFQARFLQGLLREHFGLPKEE